MRRIIFYYTEILMMLRRDAKRFNKRNYFRLFFFCVHCYLSFFARIYAKFLFQLNLNQIDATGMQKKNNGEV